MKNNTARKFNGRALQDMRLNKGWTLEDMAKLLKCDPSSISLWENGKTPGPRNLKKISNLFNVQPSDLIQ